MCVFERERESNRKKERKLSLFKWSIGIGVHWKDKMFDRNKQTEVQRMYVWDRERKRTKKNRRGKDHEI